MISWIFSHVLLNPDFLNQESDAESPDTGTIDIPIFPGTVVEPSVNVDSGIGVEMPASNGMNSCN